MIEVHRVEMQQGELSFMHKEKIGDLTKLWKTELLRAINLTASIP